MRTRGTCGSFLLICMALVTAMVAVAFAFVVAMRTACEVGPAAMPAHMARECARAGVAHATEALSRDYLDRPAAPTSDASPHRILFAPIDNITQLNPRDALQLSAVPSTGTAPYVPGTDPALWNDNDLHPSANILHPYNSSNILYREDYQWFDHLSSYSVPRYIEPGYWSLDLARESDPTNADKLDFTKVPGVTPSAAASPIYYDAAWRPVATRAEARYRLRYAIMCEDLSGHLLNGMQNGFDRNDPVLADGDPALVGGIGKGTEFDTLWGRRYAAAGAGFFISPSSAFGDSTSQQSGMYQTGILLGYLDPRYSTAGYDASGNLLGPSGWYWNTRQNHTGLQSDGRPRLGAPGSGTMAKPYPTKRFSWHSMNGMHIRPLQAGIESFFGDSDTFGGSWIRKGALTPYGSPSFWRRNPDPEAGALGGFAYNEGPTDTPWRINPLTAPASVLRSVLSAYRSPPMWESRVNVKVRYPYVGPGKKWSENWLPFEEQSPPLSTNLSFPNPFRAPFTTRRRGTATLVAPFAQFPVARGADNPRSRTDPCYPSPIATWYPDDVGRFHDLHAGSDAWEAASLKSVPWTWNTTYAVGDMAYSSGNHYRCTVAGVSKASGVILNSTGASIADGTCTWQYVCQTAAYRTIFGDDSMRSLGIGLPRYDIGELWDYWQGLTDGSGVQNWPNWFKPRAILSFTPGLFESRGFSFKKNGANLPDDNQTTAVPPNDRIEYYPGRPYPKNPVEIDPPTHSRYQYPDLRRNAYWHDASVALASSVAVSIAAYQAPPGPSVSYPQALPGGDATLFGGRWGQPTRDTDTDNDGFKETAGAFTNVGDLDRLFLLILGEDPDQPGNSVLTRPAVIAVQKGVDNKNSKNWIAPFTPTLVNLPAYDPLRTAFGLDMDPSGNKWSQYATQDPYDTGTAKTINVRRRSLRDIRLNHYAAETVYRDEALSHCRVAGVATDPIPAEKLKQLRRCRLRDAERIVNDMRMSFFGANLRYTDRSRTAHASRGRFRPYDLDGDGWAICSAYVPSEVTQRQFDATGNPAAPAGYPMQDPTVPTRRMPYLYSEPANWSTVVYDAGPDNPGDVIAAANGGPVWVCFRDIDPAIATNLRNDKTAGDYTDCITYTKDDGSFPSGGPVRDGYTRWFYPASRVENAVDAVDGAVTDGVARHAPDTYFSLSGHFVLEKSHFYRIFSRGEVWDEWRRKIVDFHILESVLMIDPDGDVLTRPGNLHPVTGKVIDASGMEDTGIIFQRWGQDYFRGGQDRAGETR